MDPQNIKKAPPVRPAEKRINFIGLFVISILTLILCFIVAIIFNYSVAFLTDFIVNNLQINEFYVGKLIGFCFFFCASALVIILFIIDGEERRLRRIFGHYISRWIVDEYYPQEESAIPMLEDGLAQPAQAGSSRAAASVRPQASVVEEDYKLGKLEGTFKEYYPNGNIKKECRYIGGKLDGLFRTYYQDGRIEQETVYRNGLIEGAYRSYYEDGKLHQDKYYINGKLDGVYKALDEQGVPFFEITYKEDVQHGTDKIYDQMGVLQYLDTYKYGVLVNRKTYDEFGGLKYDQNFEDAQQPVENKQTESKIWERETQAKEKRQKKVPNS